MVEYKKAKAIYEELNPGKKYQIPNKIGAFLQLIAEKMVSRRQFLGSYHIREDLVSEGVLDCLRSLSNYNIDNPCQNPFGYFSRTIYNAFLRRIEKEVGHVNLTRKMLLDEFTDICEEGEDNFSQRGEMVAWFDNEYG